MPRHRLDVMQPQSVETEDAESMAGQRAALSFKDQQECPGYAGNLPDPGAPAASPAILMVRVTQGCSAGGFLPRFWL
ncbi:hypothetical protein LHK_00472 [Laribacter hongkongensis HLHK9]|uniref:Uncharacterized protein n=1 Tax=Laribacter hongkongensis (strain HLHK9) TaxID=557598 RepID=C1DC50_LARHH|nr:hypothetical protein LHK_00472 [Laribacter hongkongensis HLHK9]